MNFKPLRLCLLTVLVMVCGHVLADETASWQDIKIDLTGDLLTADEKSTEGNKLSFGIAAAQDGTLTRVAADDAKANAVLNGVWHDGQHGWTNAQMTIKVDGPVKIGIGNCTYGSHDAQFTDAEGNTVKFETKAECWDKNAPTEKVTYATYKGGATTLTIKGAGYTPYFSVEAVDPSELKEEVTVSFAAGEAEGSLVPEPLKKEVGTLILLPKNYTMYVEGKTLTAWTDGKTVFAPGTWYRVPDSDVTMTAKFSPNPVSLNERTEPVNVRFDFQKQNGAPSVQWQNQGELVWVTQAEVKSNKDVDGDGLINENDVYTIDVATKFSTNPGKFNNTNWNDWCQLNNGTRFTIPSCKGAVVGIEAYNALGTGDSPLTIDGQSDYASAKTISYEIANKAEAVEVVIGSEGAYYRYIQVTLPVAEKPFEAKSFDNVAGNIVWNLTDIDEYTTPNTLTPEGGYSLNTVSVGDYTVAAEAPSAGANAGIKLLKLRPTGGDNHNVEFIVKPYKGLTFTPTKVYAKVARFGTDGGTLNVSVKNAEGQEQVLATGLIPARNNKDQTSDAKGSDPNYATEFTFDIPSELATSESFTLVVTESGLATNKDWGIGDVHIEGTINGTTKDVAKYSVNALVNLEGSGSVNVYPQGNEFDEGTELTLTATENFGYDFVNWTDQNGTVVSEKTKFVYTLNADATLTANFKQVSTYALALTVEGTNDYMVTVTPEPVVIDGKWMYEEGTTVTLAAQQYEGLVTFNNWSDGDTNSEKSVSITEAVSLTAVYTEADIIAGWDFYRAGASGRKADFAAEDNDADVLNLVNSETGESSGWLDKSSVAGGGYESFKGAAVNWRAGANNGDVGHWHWQTKINAEAFTDINVQFQMLYNYNAFQKYNVEYSLDGTEWTNFGDITMSSVKTAVAFSEKLPAAANNQKELYVRMIADKTSDVDGSSSANDGNSLAMFFITGSPKLIDDGKAPVLVSTVPANGATGASATGKIVLTFDERVKLAEGVMGMMSANNGLAGVWRVEPTVSGKTVSFLYNALSYGTEYEFTMPANAIGDLTGNMLGEPIHLTFTTMNRPTVTKKLYDFIVPDNGTFKEALAAASSRTDNSQRFRIFVKQGNYVIPANQNNKVSGTDGKQYADPKTYFNSPNVSIIGEGMDNTSITNEMPNSLVDNPNAGKGGMANPLEGIRTSGVLYMESGCQNTYFQDIKLWSATADGTGRNVVLVDGGNKTICKNVSLWAYQDTYVSDNPRNLYYFEGGLLRGRTDFLCGSGDVFYNGVTLQICEKGGYIAVPRDNVKYGYVFKDCTIKGEASDVDGNYYLGRPWTKGAEVYWIDTKMEAVPTGEGWHDMSSDGCTRMAEYNSMTASGSVIDLSARTKVLGGNPNAPILTAEEAQEIGNLHHMFGDWDPTLLTEQAPVPTGVTLKGGQLTWDDSEYVLCWAICRDGKVIDFVTTPSYSVNDNAVYSVRAANEMGGLSEAAIADDGTGIINALTEVTFSNAIHNMQGVRVLKPGKGVYFVKGKKVIF